MSAPDYTIVPKPDGGTFVVNVGPHTAGTVAEDGEYPGLWSVWDKHGQFMGRVASRDEAAAFLASWFIAEEPDRP